jgi:hypothetical protein
MNKEIVRTQIQGLLETINEQIEAAREYPDKIPQIEFDLILDNLRKLYDTLHLLQRVFDQPMPPEPENKPLIKAVEKQREPRKKEEPAKKAPAEGAMDLFAEETPAFSIKLKEAREKSLGPKPVPPGSDHLKAAISINDKFIFINELFDGNLREYNETIETLNGFKDPKQAMEFFDLVRAKNFWDPASNAFKKLKEILERRFERIRET